MLPRTAILGVVRWLALVVVLLVAIGVTFARPASAQSSSDARLANDLYKTGHEKVKAGDWEGARDAFMRAYALYPQPVILANLAGAEVQTGRLVQATEHYRQFLKNTQGLDPSEVEIAKKAMATVEARLAHLRITVANAKPSDSVELDGHALPPAALDIDYPVDPGKHILRIIRDGAEDARADVTVAERETKSVRLVAKPVAYAAPVIGPPPSDEKDKKSGGSIFSSPWFWVASGVVVIGAATAICLGAICRSDEPYSGNLGSVTLP
jgi:Tfp pilus assembly protein PilF